MKDEEDWIVTSEKGVMVAHFAFYYSFERSDIVKHEPAVCFTKRAQRERKRWLRHYLEEVWNPQEEPTLAFDARLVELQMLNGRVTKKIKERRIP